jgi:hypothetical protein
MRFSYTIGSLEGLLDVCRTNAPINEAEGHVEQAQHERAVQACVEDAINALKSLAMPTQVDHLTRLRLEAGELKAKLDMTKEVLDNELFLSFPPEIQVLFKKQYDGMSQYHSSLVGRIELTPGA